MQVATNLVPNIPDAAPSTGAPGDETAAMVADFMAGQSVDVVDGRNWAADETVTKYINEHLLPVIPQIRQDHSALHEEWRQVARMANLMHDSKKTYNGRSNVYIPSYVSARTTLISQLSQGIFPTDDYIGVTDAANPNDSNPPNAQAVKTYVKWEIIKVAKLRRYMKGFLGSFIDYGYAVLKHWYEKETTGKRKMKLKKSRGALDAAGYEDSKPCREGLRVSARSVYDFYVYPYNIDTLEEASIVFEDVPVGRAYIMERERLKEWENCDKLLSINVVPEAEMNAQDAQLENMGAPTNQSEHASSNLAGIFTMTEVWCNMPLPKAAYTEAEVAEGSVGTPIPCKLMLSGDVIAQVVRNPFWHQTVPYLVHRDDPKPGSWYGKGKGFKVKGIQYLINDFSNQMNDNGNMGMNPMVILNPTTMAGPITPFKPGGIWQTTDVANGIKFDRPPIEQVQYGMQFVQLYAAMLADHSGATPSLQGKGGGGSGKTATGMQLLQKNAVTPLKDTVEDIEEAIMSPLIEAAWNLGQQYREEKFMMEVMGDTGGWMPKSMTRQQLAGDFLLEWMASNQQANAQQRAMQGMQLLQGLTPPMVQLLASNGYQVNPYPLMERIYKDALGFRDFTKFVFKMQQQPMLGPDGQPMPPGGAPPLGGEGDMRSAAVQNPNGAMPDASTAAPGEADEFAALRQRIEEMTAEQGQDIPQEE